MARLRAVAVGMSPLLADIVRHVLTSRSQIEIVAELAASPSLIERLQALAPDLVMISETTVESVPTGATIAAALKHARVVTLSRDGRFIMEAGEERELTADTLASLLPQRPAK
jgi:chemotaxis response regulator CheB